MEKILKVQNDNMGLQETKRPQENHFDVLGLTFINFHVSLFNLDYSLVPYNIYDIAHISVDMYCILSVCCYDSVHSL